MKMKMKMKKAKGADMNPYMTCFAFFGVIYILVLIWGVISWIPLSIIISFFGIGLCSTGWWISKELTS